MELLPIYLDDFLLVICFLMVAFNRDAGNENPAYLPDNISISCGSSGTFTAYDSREWIGDSNSRLTSLLHIKGSSMTSGGADPVPYTAARISRSQFSYTFHLKPGPKLIRLHFKSIPYYKKLQDLFGVKAGNFTLLSHFSASITANALGTKSVVKEFYLSIQENAKLEIIFSAESSGAKETFAFINGIEINSVPPHLCIYDHGIEVVGQNSLAYIDYNMAQEIVHRVHINRDSADHDSWNMFGMQTVDEQRDGKWINQITWNVPVDLGFSYLVRLHFRKVGLSSMNFTFLIKEMIAASTDDILRGRGYSDIPLHVDRMVIIRGPEQQGKRDLSFSLLLNSEFMDEYGPIEVFEIFKLSNPYNSLASLNPLPQPRNQPSQAWHSVFSFNWKRNVTKEVFKIIVTLLTIILHVLGKLILKAKYVEERKPSARAARLYRRFSLADIQAATRVFSDGLMQGGGGFGRVYKGVIDNEKVTVAIKRLKHNSTHGSHEFWTQIETLSELRHINLVSLIGFCCEQGEQILVCEYMAGGTLAGHLKKLGMDGKNHFSWQHRLRICIDVARGLDYLHTGCGVIHQYITASNILLDENSVAKISNFGIAKPHNVSNPKCIISSDKLAEKSDVYAFGVVLLEVLSGRLAPHKNTSKVGNNTSAWAQELISNQNVDPIVDSRLQKEITPESLNAFMEVVEGCFLKEPVERPTMVRVVQMLEFALKQQQIKAPIFADQQPAGDDPTSESKNQEHDKLSNHGDKPWHLSYSDLAAATGYFCTVNRIGFGTFGAVHRTILHDGHEIAIKRSRTCHHMRKFQRSELHILCHIPPHRNFCRLVGFSELRNQILVAYEHMENGSISYHLQDSCNVEKNSSMINSWKIRIKISLGAAQGIEYLREGLADCIPHGNVKSSNILLDVYWNARVSIYGLLFMYVDNDIVRTNMHHDSHMPGALAQKVSDVCSLGIVLLELLTGKRAKFHDVNGDFMGIESYAMPEIKAGKWSGILDPRVGPLSLDETRALEMMVDAAAECICFNGDKWSPMREIFLKLENKLSACKGDHEMQKILFLPP